MNKISYYDIDEDQTDIFWYSVATVADPVYTFCATGTPLTFRWMGERYDTVRGSSITFNVLIQSDADRDQIYKLLDAPYYVHIKKHISQTLFIGRVFPKLFTETVAPYPYSITIKATDQLGQLDKYRPLMTDFPEPFNPTAPEYNVLDIINKLLTDPTFKPVSTEPTAPDKLNVSMSIYWNSIKLKALETTFLDPLSFMDDNDTYITKHEILDRLFKAFQLKIYQWQGEWWLMSWDAQWNNGKFSYLKYTIDWTAGWTLDGQFEADRGFLDLNNCKMLKGSGSMEFLPAWQGVQYSADLMKNNSVWNLFANRSGSFYSGTDTVRLEYEKRPTANILRHWDSSDSWVNPYPADNSGNLGAEAWVSINHPVAYVTFTIPEVIDTAIKKFEFSFFYDHAVSSRDEAHHFNIRYTKNGVVRYLINDNGLKWTDTAATVEISLPKGTGSMQFNGSFARPLDAEVGDSEIYIQLFAPTWTLNYDETGNARYQVWYKNMLFSTPMTEMESVNYKDETLFSFYEIDLDGSEPPVAWDMKWGMNIATLSSDHYYIINNPYRADGVPINAWMKEPVTDSTGRIQPLKEWLLAELTTDNVKVTRRIKGSFLVDDMTIDLTPNRVVIDADGHYYQFANGEYDEKNKVWRNVNFIEFKGLKIP